MKVCVHVYIYIMYVIADHVYVYLYMLENKEIKFGSIKKIRKKIIQV